jgi:hypothetical protein
MIFLLQSAGINFRANGYAHRALYLPSQNSGRIGVFLLRPENEANLIRLLNHYLATAILLLKDILSTEQEDDTRLL